MYLNILGFFYLTTKSKAEQPSMSNMEILTQLVSYLGVGALVHAWMIGSNFDTQDLWSWGYLLAWPIPLIGWFAMTVLVFGFWILVLLVAIAAVWWIAMAVIERNDKGKDLSPEAVEAALRDYHKKWGTKS